VPFELLGPLAYARRDCFRRSHMPEGDLKRKLHRIRPCCVGFTLDNGGLPEIDPEQQLRTPEPSRGEGKAQAVRRSLRRCRGFLYLEIEPGNCPELVGQTNEMLRTLALIETLAPR